MVVIGWSKLFVTNNINVSDNVSQMTVYWKSHIFQWFFVAMFEQWFGLGFRIIQTQFCLCWPHPPRLELIQIYKFNICDCELQIFICHIASVNKPIHAIRWLNVTWSYLPWTTERFVSANVSRSTLEILLHKLCNACGLTFIWRISVYHSFDSTAIKPYLAMRFYAYAVTINTKLI